MQRWEWNAHIDRMTENRLPRLVRDNIPTGKLDIIDSRSTFEIKSLEEKQERPK